MQRVYLAEHLIDAHLVRGRLQAEGIDAWVAGEYLTGAMGELPTSGLLAVCVRDDQVEGACCLLREWQQADAVSEPEAAPIVAVAI